MRILRGSRLGKAWCLAAKIITSVILFCVAEQSFADHNNFLYRSHQTTPDAHLREEIKSLIQSSWTPEKPTLSFWGAILPSDNINKNPEKVFFDTTFGKFIVTGGGEIESGLGASFGGELSWRQPLVDGTPVEFELNAGRTWYPEERLRSLSLGGSVEFYPSLSGKVAKATVYSDITARGSLGSDPTLTLNSGVKLMRPIIEGSAIGSAQLEYRKNLEEPKQSGPFLLFAMEKGVMSGDRYSVALGTRISRHTPEPEHYKYTALSAWASATGSFEDIYLQTRISYTPRHYDGLFPWVGEARKDEEVAISATLGFKTLKIGKLSPRVNCTFQDTRSNIALFEYATTDCSMSLGYDF